MKELEAEYGEVVKFLSGQLEDSKEEFYKIMMQVWQEKTNLIEKFLGFYTSVLEAFCDKEPGKYYHKLTELNEMMNSGGGNPDPQKQDSKNPYRGEVVLCFLQKMLKPDYSPPNDYICIQANLIALWVFYKIIPWINSDRLPLSVVARLDLAFIKLHGHAMIFLNTMDEQGNYGDKVFSRNKKISNAKHEKEENRHIIAAYSQIEVSDKSKNQIAKEIREVILSQWQTVPSTDTIKRYLTEKKMTPF